MSNRLDKEREQRLQPIRVEFAKEQLQRRGIEVKKEDATSIVFEWKGSDVIFYPYSGWASGKTINDCRGLKNLLKQLK